MEAKEMPGREPGSSTKLNSGLAESPSAQMYGKYEDASNPDSIFDDVGPFVQTVYPEYVTRPASPPQSTATAIPVQSKQESAGNVFDMLKRPTVKTYPSEIPSEFQGVFHPKVERILSERFKQNSQPIEFQIAGLIAAFGAALGSSYRLQVKQSYFVSAIFWTACIGAPGSNKSSTLEECAATLKSQTLKAESEYRRKLKLHEDDQRNQGALGYEMPEPFEQTYLESFTGDRLYEIIRDNPRGLLIKRDELLSWLNEMDKYSKGGGDRQFLLSLWNGSGFTIQKIKGDIFAERSHLNLCGGIQPGTLKTLSAGPDDGLVSRFLFFGDPFSTAHIPALTDYQSAYNNRTDWQEITNKLLSLRSSEPQIIPYEEAGFVAEQNFHQRNVEFAEMGDSGLFAKLNDYRKRLALLLQFLDWACSESAELPKEVSGQMVIRAAKLVDYCCGIAQKVYEFTTASPLEKLPENKRNFYESLKSPFHTNEAISAGKEFGLKERSIKEFLKAKELFKRMSQGFYTKNY